jgi:biopolymer transport protein ExbD
MRFAVLAVLALGCAPPAEDAAAIDPASLVLPSSTTAVPANADLPTVILTKTKLELSGAPRDSVALPLGLESMDGNLIAPLRDWLKETPHEHDVAIAIDSAAKSALAMKVMATCLDAGFTTFHVAVSREGSVEQIPLAFGKADPPGARSLTASVFGGGVVLKVPEGTLTPACLGVGEGVAVSRVDGVIDRATLGRCVAAAHRAHKTNVASVLVTPETPFSDVVTLLDAMRHDAQTDAISVGITQ